MKRKRIGVKSALEDDTVRLALEFRAWNELWRKYDEGEEAKELPMSLHTFIDSIVKRYEVKFTG